MMKRVVFVVGVFVFLLSCRVLKEEFWFILFFYLKGDEILIVDIWVDNWFVFYVGD